MRAQNQEGHAADMSSSSELASTIEASGPSDAVGLDDGLVAPMNTETTNVSGTRNPLVPLHCTTTVQGAGHVQIFGVSCTPSPKKVRLVVGTFEPTHFTNQVRTEVHFRFEVGVQNEQLANTQCASH